MSIGNKNKFLLTISALSLLLVLGACSKLCNSGYEGSRCNVLSITKFEGNWSAVDTPGNLNYTDTITKGVAINDIILSPSFANHHFTHAINASVLENVVTIPYQQPDSASNFVQGSGTLNSDNIHISFSYQLISVVDTGRVILNYAGAWSRQN